LGFDGGLRPAVALIAGLLALCFMTSSQAWSSLPSDPPDPGGSGFPDVEPEPMDPDVDPVGDVYDVDPTPDHYDADHKSMDDEESEEKGAQGKKKSDPKRLPPHGRAHRPLMPLVSIDLMEYGGGVVGQAAAQIDLAQMGEDLYLSLVLGTVFVGENWAVAPRLPLRIRLLDAHPKSDAIVREQDWDELSDFARLIAFYRYGHIGSSIYIRAGELTGATLGHGSFVNRYYNTIDIDHYQGGVYGFVDADHVGGEWLIDNLLDPDLLVGRVFVRPLESLDDLPFAAEKLKFGATFGFDHQAPTLMAVDDQGGLVIKNESPVIEKTDSISFGGLDLEVPAVSTPHLDLVPYLDVNLLDMGEVDGVGVHTGSYVNLRFNPLSSLRTRLEYRHSSGGYEPNYVNGFYEVQRVRHRSTKTKLSWLRGQESNSGLDGFYIETEYRLAGVMRYMVVYANDEGPENADLAMRLQFPKIGPLRLSFFLARFDFDNTDDFLDLQDTVVSMSGRFKVHKRFFVKFRVTKEWWLSRLEDNPGAYETTWDYNIGVGLLLNL
jgi:hypothetical protein